jgi:hypothetical protein
VTAAATRRHVAGEGAVKRFSALDVGLLIVIAPDFPLPAGVFSAELVCVDDGAHTVAAEVGLQTVDEVGALPPFGRSETLLADGTWL